MSNEIRTGFAAGFTLYATIRQPSTGYIWNTSSQAFEAYAAANITDYDIALTDSGLGYYTGDFPTSIANGTYETLVYEQVGATPATTDIPFGGPVSYYWNGSTLSASPSPGLTGTAKSCADMIDEIQARTSRTDQNEQLIDVTRCTWWLNEAQRYLVQHVPGIPSLSFKNTTSHDTTGTISYSITDITIGDSTTDRPPCRVTDVWYLDGHESCRLQFIPLDEFDALHPDPTHADEAFGKPKQWTIRNNTTIELYPYCSSAYWNKNLRFDGDYYPAEFTTDDSDASDISMASEGLILFGVYKAWQAIGNTEEMIKAKRSWSNPGSEYEPGWYEEFKDRVQSMPGWEWNLFYPE